MRQVSSNHFWDFFGERFSQIAGAIAFGRTRCIGFSHFAPTFCPLRLGLFQDNARSRAVCWGSLYMPLLFGDNKGRLSKSEFQKYVDKCMRVSMWHRILNLFRV